MSKCKFILAWVGECGKEDCEEHKDLKCSSCKHVKKTEQKHAPWYQQES